MKNGIKKLSSFIIHHSSLIFYLLFSIYYSLFTDLHAQVGFGVGVEPSGWGDSPKRMRQKSRIDPYSIEISTYFQMDVNEIAKLFSEGFGRKETIKLILISRQSNRPLAEIIRLRKKKTTFSELSKKYALNHSAIKDEADEIFRKIKYTIAISTYSIYQSTTTEVKK